MPRRDRDGKSRGSGVRCVAGNCGNTNADGCSMHSFPKNQALRRIWTNFVKTKRANWAGPTVHSVLCSSHFTPESFPFRVRFEMEQMGRTPKKVTLNDDAVPTIHSTVAVDADAGTSENKDTLPATPKQSLPKLEMLSPTEDSMCQSSPPKKIRRGYLKRESARLISKHEEELAVPCQSNESEETEMPESCETAVEGRNSDPTADNQNDSTVESVCQANKVKTRSRYCQTSLKEKKLTTKPVKMVDAAVQVDIMPMQTEPKKMQDAFQLVRPENLLASYPKPPKKHHISSSSFENEGPFSSPLKDDLKDADYTPTSSPASSNIDDNFLEEEISALPLEEEAKYIVYGTKLMELFTTCVKCSSRTYGQPCYFNGTLIKVKQECLNCLYVREWYSQPFVGSKPAGNLLMSAGILFSGSIPTKILRMYRHMKIQSISISTYMQHQKYYLNPAIGNVWFNFQKNYVEYCSEENISLNLGGDGRADTPGHSAKYGSYTMLDLDAGLVVDLQLVQSNEVKSSCHMEKEGLRRSVEFFKVNNMPIKSIVTDRHVQIKKWIRENMEKTTHMFDVWHVAKGLKKKLFALSKEKECSEVTPWIKSLVNHLYWTAATSGDKSNEETMAKWESVVNHITNIHTDHSPLFPSCVHGSLEGRERQKKWFKPGTKVFEKLEIILTSKQMKKDIPMLSCDKQTSSLEGFHSVINHFAPKMIAFSYHGMLSRLWLAALHFNENSNRDQSYTADGKARFKMVFPKFKKGEHTIRKIPVDTTYGLLSMWCEELGRLLLLRHQKNRNPDSKTPGMHPQLKPNMPPMPPMSGDPNGPWCPGNQGQPGQGLSVVTTVWGMTNTTQTAPFNHQTPGYTTTMSSTNYTQHPQGFQVNSLQKYNPTPNNIPYRRPSYPPTPNTPGSNTPSNNDYPGAPQQGNPALSAALVAAAATASATATATATMMMQNDHPNNQQMNMQMNMNSQYGPGMQQQMPMGQYGNQYPQGMSQRHPGPMNMGPGPGSGPGPMKNPMYQRRPTPYHNPHASMMGGKRPPFPNGPQYGNQPYNSQQPYSGGGKYPPTQQPLPSPTYHQQQPGMRPNPAGQYPNGQNPYYNPSVRGPMPPQGQNFNQYMPQQSIPSPPSNYPHSPLPGNPTPPITPGPGPNGYTGPMPNGPPLPMKKDPDELRLTFPVRDGVVLPPFRLEHNLAVSNHVFHLRESVYQTLMFRSDLELQLKCFHHEDRQMNTNWPASVTVSVNANPLNIERGENKTSHKPLYLKDVCQPGRNTIQITVTACCCSHLFVLQLVHRPSVRSVLQGLLRKRLLPAEHCITKIKRNFSNVAPNSLNGEDGVEQTAIKVSLKCPITFRRITLPARGHECKHIQCFDLESYLQLNCERGSWRCPVCNKTALLEGLEIDQYIWGILTNLQTTEFEEVTIDPMAAWKPVQHKTIKEEEADPCAGRWIKAMSPSSMQMPTMNSWDMGRQPSPFNMPPSSQNMQGPPYSNMHSNEVMANGGPSPMNYPHPSTPGDYNNPLSHMSPPGSVDPLNNVNNMNNDIHSSTVDIKNHMSQYLPTTSDTTPLRHPDSGNINNCGTPSSQSQNHINGSHINHGTPNGNQTNNSGADSNNIGDLTFDPSSVIDGEGQSSGLPDLDLNMTDPMELLSYLGPSENSNNNSGSNNVGNNGSNQNSSNSTSNNNDDLLALFE